MEGHKQELLKPVRTIVAVDPFRDGLGQDPLAVWPFPPRADRWDCDTIVLVHSYNAIGTCVETHTPITFVDKKYHYGSRVLTFVAQEPISNPYPVRAKVTESTI
jgi:hypothetical protein